MSWREWITQSYADRAEPARSRFYVGATVESLERLATALGVCLPPFLRELLLESDGVDQLMPIDDEWSPIHTEVWSCDRMLKENRAIRSAPHGPSRPPDGQQATPLYFANCDGTLFAFMVHDSGVMDPAVYAFDPIEREWSVVSPSLREHMRGWSI
jgi:hypothetical protein